MTDVAEGSRDLICLCTQPPKVPRPRNAFILYRQHHQGQVAQNNPGLANPEISKIIGELWRDEPEERKNTWKRLAEQEKQRHQQQYPDYRYQPRRGGKGAAARPTPAAGEDPGRCPKCGGRYIATPRTPSTPMLTPAAAMAPMTLYNTPGSRKVEAEYHHHASHALQEENSRGRGYGTATYDRDDYDMMSPTDSKRRRFQGGYPSAQNAPPPVPYNSHPRQHMRTSSVGAPPSAQAYTQSGPLPGPAMLTRVSPGPVMGPPPRPSIPYPSPTSRTSIFDESLRLPPLQTQMPTSPQSDTSAHASGPMTRFNNAQHNSLLESQAKSIEAMVMSISYLNKLKVLEKISPPLAPPGPGSPAVEVRGPVIAIEGPNSALLRQIAPAVERALVGSGECAVRVWTPGSGALGMLSDEAGGLHDGSASKSSRSGSIASIGSGSCMAANPFGAYLSTIQEWHAKSAEMVRFITTRPSSGRGSNASSASDGQKSDNSAHTVDTSTSDRRSSVPPPSQQYHSGHSRSQLLPVALVPSGFSLTISDRFASTVPIQDSYAPVDHWQWMATLWRGIVGADLVIYVRSANEAELNPTQAVELKAAGVMAVHIADWTALDEKTERRLGFEVLEWVRGGSFQAGL
ncbi:hypothetical protein GQ53DRAFT_806406 [Thozetella sp. PMI_491]|nr:hypothetical protein GQ53DRAFT_806406 [Thozetella sp. PMI_491]